MTEFKILEDFPNYEIWDNGDIFNKNTNFQLFGTRENGYRRYNLFHINGKQKHILHHQLIAKAFIPNPNNCDQIDHIDGNKSNNSISNLRWCNNSENGRNREIYSFKKLGRPDKKFKFVNWNNKDKIWQGEIRKNKKYYYVGHDILENDQELYKKCLQTLSDISTTEELLFYNKQVLDDMIKYEILIIYS